MGFNSAFKGLNELVRFAERRNLVSARVPSHFNWPLTAGTTRTNSCYSATLHLLTGCYNPDGVFTARYELGL